MLFFKNLPKIQYYKEALMFNIKFILVIAAFTVIFVLYVRHIRENYDKSKSNWKKLFLEFFIASFVFLISVRIFGLFGVKLTENFWLFGMLILLIIPIIVGLLYYIYSRKKIKYHFFVLDLSHCIIFNRFYKMMVAVNLLWGLKSKLF